MTAEKVVFAALLACAEFVELAKKSRVYDRGSELFSNLLRLLFGKTTTNVWSKSAGFSRSRGEHVDSLREAYRKTRRIRRRKQFKLQAFKLSNFKGLRYDRPIYVP